MSKSNNSSRLMSFVSGSFLWFGAAISIAEIATGALLSSLGFLHGFFAILLGHLIGCTLFFFAGFIGAKNNTSAMESARYSFGKYGSILFSVLNILQLIGWTAVMIIGASRSASAIFSQSSLFGSSVLWSIFIGLLICLWVFAGISNVGKLNLVAVTALFGLTVLLGFVVFSNTSSEKIITKELQGVMSFSIALELSIAMPLSWLPLISDYTKNTKKPFTFTLVSTLFYFLGSTFMYTIGLGAAIFAGTADIVSILLSVNLGTVALLIVIFSTVTTTFLDVHSAGMSFVNISKKITTKNIALITCLIGVLLAIFIPIDQYENFLLLIGSVFVPMIVILISDFFIFKKSSMDTSINWHNIILWLIGFIIYRFLLLINLPIGSTLPVMIITFILCMITHKINWHSALQRN
ncbi:MAG: putative hydroxymethylpyrimidine transporter CytX [Treponemataceae bacterium]